MNESLNHQVEKTTKPTAISLFAGAGGCSLGFEEAGFDIVFASDINYQAVATYKLNFPNTICEQSDISRLDFHNLLRRLDVKSGEVDIVIGGPPCQGFSSAGMQFWDDPRNAMLKHYVAALEIIRPKWFLIENVEGLLTAHQGTYIYELSQALIELGYRIRIDKIYAHEFGVPQRRKRVLIVGNRIGVDYSPPQIISYATGRIFRRSSLSTLDAISGLPKSSRENIPLAYDTNPTTAWEKSMRRAGKAVSQHYSPALSNIQLARVQHLAEGQTMKDLPAELQHESFKRRANRRVMDGTPTEKRGGAPSGLKRLIGSEASLTITGAAIRELIHPIEDRPLTLRESARLQTFPDTFEFYGSRNQISQQIGNAIPPQLAKHVALHIKTLNSTPEANVSHIGRLLGYSLTKAQAMSPALQRTNRKLLSLSGTQFQPSLF